MLICNTTNFDFRIFFVVTVTQKVTKNHFIFIFFWIQFELQFSPKKNLKSYYYILKFRSLSIICYIEHHFNQKFSFQNFHFRIWGYSGNGVPEITHYILTNFQISFSTRKIIMQGF